MSDAFAELFEHNPLGSAIVCPIAGEFFQWQTSAPGLAGPDDLMVADGGADQVRVEGAGAGIYLVMLSMAFSTNRNNIVVEGGVFKNGVILQNVRFSRTLMNMNDEASVVAIGLVQLVAADALDVRVSTDFMDTDVQVVQCNLTALAYPKAIPG